MIQHVVQAWWNEQPEQPCYEISEHGRCIIDGFSCSNSHERLLHVGSSLLNNAVGTIVNSAVGSNLLFTHDSRHVTSTACWANNIATGCAILAVYKSTMASSEKALSDVKTVDNPRLLEKDNMALKTCQFLRLWLAIPRELKITTFQYFRFKRSEVTCFIWIQLVFGVEFPFNVEFPDTSKSNWIANCYIIFVW